MRIIFKSIMSLLLSQMKYMFSLYFCSIQPTRDFLTKTAGFFRILALCFRFCYLRNFSR